MKKTLATISLLSAVVAAPVYAVEGSTPVSGVEKLDHVFVIMMENHGYHQIIGNPNAPFINKFAKNSNLANYYFAVAHPSLTNYLEVVGGSNFGIQNDHSPDWHDASCTPDIVTGTLDNEATTTLNGTICPISGKGTDAATSAVDTTNETSPPSVTLLNNIDGVKSISALSNVSGKTIADQLAYFGKSWKSYQESIPQTGVDQVNLSDGPFSNLTNFTALSTPLAAFNSGDLVGLYASKHNPFVYFKSVQEGSPESGVSLKNTASFETLYSELANGNVPSFSFIVPNQCNDQHGRGNAGAFCNYDPSSDGTQAGLNPALIKLGDVALEKLITAIHNSPAWEERKSAIVVLWDENDYSGLPINSDPNTNINQVALIVDTNYGVHGKTSSNYYNHFSLLKTIEGALGLPCLNHACDSDVNVMSDLFGAERRNH